MVEISNLVELLKNMNPIAAKGKYHIASVEESQLMTLANYLEYIQCIYREEEGLSVVFSEDLLGEMKGMTEKTAGPFALITLNVESDLFAIGFLAKITDALAKKGISVNAFSAYHHGHLLVPYERKEDALKTLKSLK